MALSFHLLVSGASAVSSTLHDILRPRYPAENIALLPLLNASSLLEHAKALKDEYWNALQHFGNRTDISQASFERSVGSFAFLDPVAVLSILRGGRLDLSTESLVDIGGGGHIPSWLQAFVRQDARVLAFDASGFDHLLKVVNARKAALGAPSRPGSGADASTSAGAAPATSPSPRQKMDPRSKDARHVLTAGKLTVHKQAVTPPTIAKQMASHGIIPPRASLFSSQGTPTMLKIDIDSIDCEVMEAVLVAGYSPDLIVIETNPAYPPPIHFKLRYGAHAKRFFHAGGAHHILYGCSLSAANHIAKAHGYTLLQFVIEDAYFVRTAVISKFAGSVPGGPSEAFAMGNPYTYYFEPGAFRRRRGLGAQGSLAPGTVMDWAQRGQQLAQLAHAREGIEGLRYDMPHGGFARAIARPERFRGTRDVLSQLVLANMTALAKRIFSTRSADGAEKLAGTKVHGAKGSSGVHVEDSGAAASRTTKEAPAELQSWMTKVFDVHVGGEEE